MRIVYEILFLVHLVAILLAISIGFFLPLSIVVALVFLHRIHILVFHGCVLSRIQRVLGGLPCNQGFLEICAQRIFKKTITRRQGALLDYACALTPVVIALIP